MLLAGGAGNLLSLSSWMGWMGWDEVPRRGGEKQGWAPMTLDGRQRETALAQIQRVVTHSGAQLLF